MAEPSVANKKGALRRLFRFFRDQMRKLSTS